MAKVSDAQQRANRRWEKKNPEASRIINYRSKARTFIRKYSDFDDLDELETLIKDRRKKLVKEKEKD